MKILELPQHWRPSAMVLSAIDDPASWFNPEEQEIIAAFRHEKRRREWMLSRIAEKELRRGGAAGVCVSYSHSAAFGAAAVSDGPIGIDVEVKRVIPQGAVHLFLTDQEAEIANACAIENALLHFWSAKEAKWKQLGGALPTLKRVPLDLVEVRPGGLLFAGVETVVTDEAIVALTLR